MTIDEQPKFTKEPRRHTIIRDYIQKHFPCKFRAFDQYDNSMCLRIEDAPGSCWCDPCKERQP